MNGTKKQKPELSSMAILVNSLAKKKRSIDLLTISNI